MASDILQPIDQLKINKASIVGWSDGGIIRLLLAIKEPQWIHQLFTFGSNYNVAGCKDESSDMIRTNNILIR